MQETAKACANDEAATSYNYADREACHSGQLIPSFRASMTVPTLPSAPISIDALQAHGVTDPQLRIFDNKAYLYASHDHAPTNTRFVMPDWQLWSSEDLLNWQYETTLSPTHTHIGKPFDGCWAG